MDAETLAPLTDPIGRIMTPPLPKGNYEHVNRSYFWKWIFVSIVAWKYFYQKDFLESLAVIDFLRCAVLQFNFDKIG